MGDNLSDSDGSPNHPVGTVSWDDCQAFIEQLGDMGLGTFRLPTEAEWEYACRAETDTRFSFGDALECDDDGIDDCEIMDEYMWWAGSWTLSSSLEVGGKLPNPWGLHDMHGSLFEWCADRWQSYDFGPQVDPQGPGPTSGRSRVLRGGSYLYQAGHCRSAARGARSPGARSSRYGFRLVRSYESESNVEGFTRY